MRLLQTTGRESNDLLPLSSVGALLTAQGCAIWVLAYPGRMAESIAGPVLFLHAWSLWHMIEPRVSFLVLNLLVIVYLWVRARTVEQASAIPVRWVKLGYLVLALAAAAMQLAIRHVDLVYYPGYTLKVIYDAR